MSKFTIKTKLLQIKPNFFQGGPANPPYHPEMLLACRKWCSWLTNAAAVPTTPSRARDRRFSGRNGNETFARLTRGWPGGISKLSKKDGFWWIFMVFGDFLDHPLASRTKVLLPFRPETLLSRALEGVVGTATALVSQEYPLRQPTCSNTSGW